MATLPEQPTPARQPIFFVRAFTELDQAQQRMVQEECRQLTQRLDAVFIFVPYELEVGISHPYSFTEKVGGYTISFKSHDELMQWVAREHRAGGRRAKLDVLADTPDLRSS